MCGRRLDSRPAAPPGSRGRFIHSAPETADQEKGAPGRSGQPRPQPTPGVQATPRFPPAGEESLARPAPVPRQTPSPQPRPPPGTGTGLASRAARGLAAREPPASGFQRRPEVSSAPPPQRPTSPPPRPDPSPRCLGPLSGCRVKRMAARPGALVEESRAGGPKPAWAVTLMILRGSPAILSDPEFGLCSCLRLRSPHARVEVPDSTSGGRRRARRRCLRRGPSGNVVPAWTRASGGLPSDLMAPSPALPAPTPAGGGGSDAPRRGRDLGEAAPGSAELLRPRQNLRETGCPASTSSVRATDHACAGGRRNKGPAPGVAHSFIRSICSFNVPALRGGLTLRRISVDLVIGGLVPNEKHSMAKLLTGKLVVKALTNNSKCFNFT
ncbi:hypothetical protein NN561_007991 [Cricetulus griseus]